MKDLKNKIFGGRGVSESCRDLNNGDKENEP